MNQIRQAFNELEEHCSALFIRYLKRATWLELKTTNTVLKKLLGNAGSTTFIFRDYPKKDIENE